MLWILLLCAAVPLHRQHRRMDDGGIRTPAVAGVRPDAHGGRAIRHHVHAGNRLFTLLGFMGLYALLAILFLFLVLPGDRATGRWRRPPADIGSRHAGTVA